MTGALRTTSDTPAGGERSVRLTGRDLEDATRLLALLTRADEPNEDSPWPGGRHRLIEAARVELDQRKMRTALLPAGMFGEPAWEILLLLYSEQEGMRFNIAALSGRLDLPTTSTLRWLAFLQERQFVTREEHPTDQRSVFLKLTPGATDILDRYFSRLLRTAR